MYSYLVSAVVGALAGWLCTDSALEYAALLVVSLGWGAVLSRFSGSMKQWGFGVAGYCSGVLFFSKNFAGLYALSTKGFYGTVIRELPELFLMAIILPLLGVVVTQLILLVIKD